MYPRISNIKQKFISQNYIEDFVDGDFQGLRSKRLSFGQSAGPMAGAGPIFGIGWFQKAALERIFQILFMKHFLCL